MAAPPLPAGTVTFLFTDVEGSTRLLKRLGPAYGATLARHHELLREAIAGHGGREVDTQGEAFFVAFPRAKDAVAAAAELHRSHASEPRESQTRSGYLGNAVLGAFALCNVATPGQVVVSAATAAVADDSTMLGIALRPLGERELTQFARPVALYEAVADA